MSRRLLRLALASLLCSIAGSSIAQQPLLDRGARAAGLWCFPLAGDEQRYVYLPAEVRLDMDEQDRPRFSFVTYVINTEGEGNSRSITRADGGGILHFIVLYETPPERIEAAQTELRRILGDPSIELRGPVVFRDGRYSLVSSVLNFADGAGQRSILATGRAPVLEGNRLAFSFHLEPKGALLLLETFKTAAPDVSLVFDMTLAGLTDAYEAELVVDWAAVRTSRGFEAGGSLYYVGADIEELFEELRRDNAIELRTRGSNARGEALLQVAYEKLMDLMFRPVEPETAPAEQRGGLVESLSALIQAKDGPLSARELTGFGAHVGYRLKEMRSAGTTVINLNHQQQVERHASITFNIGTLHERYGNDATHFRVVNLADPAFEQREIRVAVDGALRREFDHSINSATVTLRKKHASGRETVRELVLDRESVDRDDGMRLVYGFDGDNDRLAWLDYEHRTRWSFQGGGRFETDWVRTDSPMIDLFAPYERRTILLIGGRAALRSRDVRAVVVEVEYPFFGERRREMLVVRPERDGSDPTFEITLPLGAYDYEYSITWQMAGGRQLKTGGRDSTGVLFLDELPGAPAAVAPAPGK